MIIAVLDQEAEYIDLLKKYLQDIDDSSEIVLDWGFKGNGLSKLPEIFIANYDENSLALFKKITSLPNQKKIPFLFLVDSQSFSFEMKELQSLGFVIFLLNQSML